MWKQVWIYCNNLHSVRTRLAHFLKHWVPLYLLFMALKAFLPLNSNTWLTLWDAILNTWLINAITCTVKCSYSYSTIWPFNLTVVLVPVYKNRGRINLLTEVYFPLCSSRQLYAPFQLVVFGPSSDWHIPSHNKEAVNKLTSVKRFPCQTVKT